MIRAALTRPGSRAGHAAAGVTSQHVIPTALVMVALPLMEATTSRAAIAERLGELQRAYVEVPEGEPEQDSGPH